MIKNGEVTQNTDKTKRLHFGVLIVTVETTFTAPIVDVRCNFKQTAKRVRGGGRHGVMSPEKNRNKNKAIMLNNMLTPTSPK